jgi:cyclophilin family peptidyl-prolyl cis-trans isomerase
MIRTRFGRIILRLNTEQAPVTANNFLQYIDDGFFDGRDGGGPTIFHRVIGDFMIQGGGFLANGGRKRTRGPIILESMNGLLNRRGTIAMARTEDPNSATSQFFINHVDNDFLNHRPGSDGYAVFGEVIEGMEVVDAIAAVATDAQDIPIEPVIIEEAIRWIED